MAAALAVGEGRPPLRRAALAAGGLGLLLLLLIPLGGAFVGASAVTVSMGALVAAAYLCARAARLPAGPSQVLASLVPVALYALVFGFGPVLEHAAGDPQGRRITLGLELSPLAVTAISILGDDFYHRPTFYSLDFAAYPHAPPRWTGTVAMYLSTAAALGALAAGLFAAFRKKPA